MAMFVRVKHNKTTYFLQCDATETILEIKRKLCALIDRPAGHQRLFLMGTKDLYDGSGELLEDSKTLADQKVENDAVLALTLRQDDNEFEEINIVRPTDY